MVYVDDIILTGNSPAALQSLITALNSEFSLKDLGTLNFFLGIEITTSPTSLHLSQH
jgi:Reverse transcriptase (RNA-dependent DNA polymerase)